MASENKTPDNGGEKKKTKNTRLSTKAKRESFSTNTGHSLTPQENEFISKYLELGNTRQAVIQAGYKTNTPDQYGQKLLNKDYINEEIKFRMAKVRDDGIASAEEIMQYFTKVMRGEIQEQFGLDAPLSERTKAAMELAKRQIDIPQRLEGKGEPQEVKIVLDWTRPTLETAPDQEKDNPDIE